MAQLFQKSNTFASVTEWQDSGEHDAFSVFAVDRFVTIGRSTAQF